MAEFTKHDPGTFSWADLSTSDLDAAIALYTDLFGWDVAKEDMPDGSVYAMFRLNGKDVAAASRLREEDVPPHWNVYVTVDDAEQTAKHAEAAGGSIVAPVFDVMEYGRMTVIADPPARSSACGSRRPRRRASPGRTGCDVVDRVADERHR